MSKVFVTGIAGFMGSHIADSYLNKGWEVVGIDSLIGGDLRNVPEGAEFLKTDCLDRFTYDRLLAGSDLVYHCAATAYDGLSVFAPAYVYRNIAQATVEVATASVVAEVGRFVQCSSMARYGNLKAPFTENMRPEPDNPYGLAKVAAEEIVKNLFETHGGEWVIAVPHNIIGPRQRYIDPYRNVASIMINRMLRGLQPYIYGDGSQQRCFSFIDDVIFCLERLGTQENVVGETINIGPDEGTISILGLAQEIASLLDFELDPIFVADRPREVALAMCSSDKARELLGYETRTTLTQGLTSMIHWIEDSGVSDFIYNIELEINTAATPVTWTNKLI